MSYRWDLLCDSLDGRGVPNLDDALVALELAPLHDALVTLLQPDLSWRACQCLRSPCRRAGRRRKNPTRLPS